MAEIGNVTVRVDAVITDEQYREAMGAVRAANERMDLLVAENAKLRHDLEEANNQAEEVCIENAKLRELVRDMWTCIQTADKSDNAWDECPRCSLWNGNNNHRCEFGRRMKELGVEV